MTRLIGAVDKNGNFVIGKVSRNRYHSGFLEESREIQRAIHAAELIQPFKPDGTRNTAYSTLYHNQAIRQGIIDEDPEPDFQKFE
jgi:hypothetical protein